MANTFTKIATVTVGSGGASNIEFTSIPSTYTDLQLNYAVRTNRSDYSADEMFIKFNSSSTSYSVRHISGAGGTASSGTGSTSAVNRNWAVGNTALGGMFSNQMLYIPNYTSSTYKAVLVDGMIENNSSTEYWIAQTAGLWSNTSAITSITMTPEVGSLVLQYSTATLYGIKNS